MLLSDSGADLLGMNEQKILAVLRESKNGLHVRQIERVAGTPHYTTGGILRRLTTTGILTEQQIGTSLVYTVNRHHVFWQPIEALLDARDSILNQFKTAASLIIRQGGTLALVGATARQEETEPNADIDLALIYPDDVNYTDVEQVTHDIQELGRQLAGNPVKITNVDYSTLAEMINVNERVLQSWLADAETLAGVNLKTLITEKQQPRKKSK